ncbi:MAG: S8/S53 family peptidase [Gemmatimonadaceae bacterium]|jgi:hypothetical protein|nr:S8/S53 family peptidase [Gemmatimonadaceae bacterium]
MTQSDGHSGFRRLTALALLFFAVEGCRDANTSFLDEVNGPGGPAVTSAKATGAEVPERSASSRLFLASAGVEERIMRTDGWVRIGLKPERANRGVWRGVSLLDEEDRKAIRLDLAEFDSLTLHDDDPLLPIVNARVASRSVLRLLRSHPNVDYVSPMFPDAEGEIPMSNSGCDPQAWNTGPLFHTTIGGDLYSSSFAEAMIVRGWEYMSNVLGSSSIGYVDTGVDPIAWPEVGALSITVVGPNNGANCSHGNRMISVTAAPRNGVGSVGVAFGTHVVSSDVGSSVWPAWSDSYSAVHRLLLAGGMPPGSRVIVLGFGLAGEYSDLRDLIEFGFYQRGFAFFSPAGTNVPLKMVVFPATMPEVFAVTARSSLSQPHPSASVGSAVDGIAFAPVFVSGAGLSLSELDASSAATALVGGVAALVSRKYPAFTNIQLYERLKSTSREHCGPHHAGVTKIINAEAALGGLCIPPGQFDEVTYSFFPGSPSSYTHSYCLQFSGGVTPVATVWHQNPHPTLPGCGSIHVVPDVSQPVSYMSVRAEVADPWTLNAPLEFYFRVKVVTQLTCPPSNPDCI